MGMTATERLRALLDERGVEHYDGTETTLWGYEPTSESAGVYRFAADETSGGRMQVRMFNCTPEQAITATLGADAKPTQAESSVALTAEQVRDAVMSADRWEKPMGNTGLTNTHLIIRDDGWQAIADELNDTLGSFNCSNSERTEMCYADETDTWECVCDGIGHYGERVTVHVMECSECGRTYEHVNGDYEYCPRCGRGVVDDG